jgi:hypothetical protein
MARSSTLVALADLAAAYLTAMDRFELLAETSDERADAAAALDDADHALRTGLGLRSPPSTGDVAMAVARQEEQSVGDPAWKDKLWRRIKRAERPSWWRRAWTWITGLTRR